MFLEPTAQMRPMLISETLLPKSRVSLIGGLHSDIHSHHRAIISGILPKEIEFREIQCSVIEAVLLKQQSQSGKASRSSQAPGT